MTYTVYILFSSQLNKYYVGYTSDLETLLVKHAYDHHGYTGQAKDWRVVYRFQCSSKSDAIKLERKIKKRGAQRFLDDLK